VGKRKQSGEKGDFQTGSGIVVTLGKWEKENKAVKK